MVILVKLSLRFCCCSLVIRVFLALIDVLFVDLFFQRFRILFVSVEVHEVKFSNSCISGPY